MLLATVITRLCLQLCLALQAVPARFNSSMRLSWALDLFMLACPAEIHMIWWKSNDSLIATIWTLKRHIETRITWLDEQNMVFILQMLAALRFTAICECDGLRHHLNRKYKVQHQHNAWVCEHCSCYICCKCRNYVHNTRINIPSCIKPNATVALCLRE